jgi:hypothetical protein
MKKKTTKKTTLKPSEPKLEVGQLLFPLSASFWGNAIVTRVKQGKSPDLPAFTYCVETDFGFRCEATYAQLATAYAPQKDGKTTVCNVKDWYKVRADQVFRPSPFSKIHPIYSVHAVSPALGLERRLLVCAPSVRSVSKFVEAHPSYRGWVVVTGDTVKLPVRARAFAKVKLGVIAAIP